MYISVLTSGYISRIPEEIYSLLLTALPHGRMELINKDKSYLYYLFFTLRFKSPTLCRFYSILATCTNLGWKQYL